MFYISYVNGIFHFLYINGRLLDSLRTNILVIVQQGSGDCGHLIGHLKDVQSFMHRTVHHGALSDR